MQLATGILLVEVFLGSFGKLTMPKLGSRFSRPEQWCDGIGRCDTVMTESGKILAIGKRENSSAI